MADHWREVRVTFLADHEDTTTAQDEDSPVMVFWKSDTFYAEVQDQGEDWRMHVLDQETALEWYDVPKNKVRILPVDYYTADVTFLKEWQFTTPDDTELTVERHETYEAGVVDDGTETVDLLLNALMRPINQIKQVPRSILRVARKPED
jgi:hypothetical protein